MKRLLITLQLLICAFVAGFSQQPQSASKVWSVETLPMVHLQDARRYVCNPDGVLAQATCDSIDGWLYQLEQQHGVQTVVVVVKRIEGGDGYEFGMALSRKYGIGSRKQNTGLIVLLSTEDRDYRILTGNGLEGSLPDAICRRIENAQMVPYLKKSEWDNAMFFTMKAIYGHLNGDDTLLAEKSSRRGNGSDQLYAFIIVSFFIIFLLLMQLKAKRKLRCPRCKKAQMVRTNSVVRGANGMMQVVYKCPHCGYTETRNENPGNNGGRGGMFIPPIFFGGRGGGFGGGGGFSGGSFGGGSFGGGGIGGKF